MPNTFTNDASTPGSILTVTPEEGGMKLVRFLERRLAQDYPQSVLHKWIRTGQIRVNKGRAKPFTRLAPGDAVRLPPFAQARDTSSRQRDRLPGCLAPGGMEPFGPGVALLGEEGGVLALGKPAGLACQGGSGQEDSLAARLAAAYAGHAYIPAPAHRLDKASSGLVLAGASHEAQRRLHEHFQRGGIARDYLAWVTGEWPFTAPCLLRDRLAKETAAPGFERMAAAPGGECRELAGSFRAEEPVVFPRRQRAPGEALCLALRVREPARVPSMPAPGSLMLVRLITGRTHQIRIQLASRGFPIIGDRRYGGTPHATMLLHALAIDMPGDATAAGFSFFYPPGWPVQYLPDADSVSASRAILDAVF